MYSTRQACLSLIPVVVRKTPMLGSVMPESQAQARAVEMAKRVAEKRHELEHLKQLEKYSRDLTEELVVMGERFSALTQGTEAVAELMSNWQLVLNNLRLAAGAVQKYTEEVYDPDRSDDVPLPEQLVRVKLDEA